MGGKQSCGVGRHWSLAASTKPPHEKPLVWLSLNVKIAVPLGPETDGVLYRIWPPRRSCRPHQITEAHIPTGLRVTHYHQMKRCEETHIWYRSAYPAFTVWIWISSLEWIDGCYWGRTDVKEKKKRDSLQILLLKQGKLVQMSFFMRFIFQRWKD